MNPPITPLECWISEKTGLPGRPDMDRLQEYQLGKLRETLRLVRDKSRFYRERLALVNPDDIRATADVARLPFTTPADLAACPEAFLCVPPSRIGRIVTLSTSGTTGRPKRLFFTDADQELTVDFFHRGMMTMASPGDRVMIFMPGSTPGSIGDLLAKGLARFDSSSVIYGPILDFADAYNVFLREKANVLVGIPSQILRLARTGIEKPALKSVLLSADTVPLSVIKAVSEAWDVPVYGHYGMTETGLGGGVECAVRDGYHLREADLLFEIVSPENGCPVSDGEYGEVVFTTLTRHGMPLVRYRTGDRARFLTAPCPCGTVLRRLDRVTGRIAGAYLLQDGQRVSIEQLDELVYADPAVLAYAASLVSDGGRDRLVLTLEADGTLNDAVLYDKLDALLGGLPGRGGLTLELVRGPAGFHTTGTLKRRLNDLRV